MVPAASPTRLPLDMLLRLRTRHHASWAGRGPAVAPPLPFFMSGIFSQEFLAGNEHRGQNSSQRWFAQSRLAIRIFPRSPAGDKKHRLSTQTWLQPFSLSCTWYCIFFPKILFPLPRGGGERATAGSTTQGRGQGRHSWGGTSLLVWACHSLKGSAERGAAGSGSWRRL